MLGSGIALIVFGLPCAALGVYLRKNPPEKKTTKGQGKKQKKKDKKKSTRRGKEDKPKDQPKQGGSLIAGGGLFTLLGIGLIIGHFMA